MTQKSKIAVTGGIGSGKTTALRLLEKLGYPVFSCDAISHRLWTEEAYRKTLLDAFPSCTTGGELDKQKLSALVFSDDNARKKLESLSQPRIMRELLAEMERYPVGFAEVPLLFEGGYEGLFDGILVVKRNREDRIASVIERDRTSREEVQKRILAQCSDAVREKGGIILMNDGTVEDLEENLKAALRSLGI